MKKCRCCGLEKPFTEFHRNKSLNDGYQIYCKVCYSIKYKEYYTRKKNGEIRKSNELTREEKLERNREYYRENKDKYKQYYLETRNDRLAYQADYWQKNPSIRKRLRNNHRISKLSATIKSLLPEDHEEMDLIYSVSRWLSLVSGENYHVDHIIPLQHDLICGLHVPWNLQILLAKDNISKSNNFQI